MSKKNTMYNIEMLYKARNNIIELFDDYSLIVSEAKLKAIKETGLNNSSCQQFFHNSPWPIVLAQLKVGNNSENLLNEIRKIVYFLYQSNGITKKVNKLDLKGGEKSIA